MSGLETIENRKKIEIMSVVTFILPIDSLVDRIIQKIRKEKDEGECNQFYE